MAGAVLRRVPLDRILGRRFRENRAFLADAQWWSRERSEQYQLERLRETLQLAESKSTFYRNSFRAAGFRSGDLHSLADIRNLPTITKDDVVGNLEEMMTCPANTSGIDYVSTGGTSGAPLAFYAPASRSAVEYAYLTSGWERAGYCVGDTMAVLRGRVVTQESRGFMHEYDPLLRQHFYSSFHMSEENVARYLRHIGSLGSCVLHAYASSATTLASVAMQSPELCPKNVKAVLLESENVFEDQVLAIREAFGVAPLSSYGHSEKLVLATACEANTRYHVWPTYGYFELLDAAGKPVTTPGQRGEIVGSGFINRVTPMIRYRTGDFAIYHDDHCSDCGRNHTVLERIEGRWPQGDLIGSDGSRISMTALNMHDDCMSRVMEYQFLQDEPGMAELRVRPGEGWSEGERLRVESMVNRRIQGQVAVTVRAVDAMHRTRVGKLLRVVNSKQVAGFSK